MEKNQRITRSMKSMDLERDGKQVSMININDSDVDDIISKVSHRSCNKSMLGSYMSGIGSKSIKSRASLSVARLKEAQLNRRLEVEEALLSDTLVEEKRQFEARMERERAAMLERHESLIKSSKRSNEMLRMDARDTIEIAQLNLDFSDAEDEVKPVDGEELEPGKRKILAGFLDDCSRVSKVDANLTKHNTQQRIDPCSSQGKGNAGRYKIELPKFELSCFDGDTAKYWSFFKQFDHFVEEQTDDPSQRLLYLLNYCKGEAKEAIEDYVIQPPERGYREARRLLKRLYGSPQIVARSLLEGVLNFPKMSSIDHRILLKLYTKMTKCWNTLEQMGSLEDLNNKCTIVQILDKLPKEMKDKWYRKTTKLFDDDKEPRFMDLIDFIDNEAKVAQRKYNTERGRMDLPVPLMDKLHFYHADKSKSTTNRTVNVTVKENKETVTDVKCPKCGNGHKLFSCADYLAMNCADRWSLVLNGGYCLSCLNKGHRVISCQFKRPCGVNGCPKRHHPTLHREEDEQTSSERVALTSLVDMEPHVYLGVLPVQIKGPKGVKRVYALLDTGANATLIKRSIVDELGVKGQEARIKLNTVVAAQSVSALRCGFMLQSLDGDGYVNVRDAFALEKFPVNLKVGSTKSITRKWPHLQGIDFDEIDEEKISIIVGCDQPKAHWVMEQRLGNDLQPFAVKTSLGWMILGPADKESNSYMVNNTLVLQENDSLVKWMKTLYNKEFEDLGNNEKQRSMEEKEALQIAEQGTEYDAGHYVVPLPWRLQATKLVNNIDYARRRLYSLKRRFLNNATLLEKYDAIIRRHVERGYVMKLNSVSGSKDSQIWYLPHHPVINPKKPDKVRIVFDCAAKYAGRSINDCLLQGPDTTANLVGLLLRFRKHPVAVAADIEEMFLQVRIPTRDRDALRFLWWTGGNMNQEPETYCMLVHPFGATSSPFCANYALSRAIRDNDHMLCPAAREVALHDIYVDDCITSVPDLETASLVIKQISEVVSLGGFRMRKWLSNKREALTEIPVEDVAEGVMVIGEQLPTERTLGVEWDTEKDELSFTFSDGNKPCTRRGVLSTIASIFDPLGLVAPQILLAKILLQNLCRSGSDWDTPLTGDNLVAWNDWKADMSKIGRIAFPRCITGTDHVKAGGLQLHLFSDASEKGYGAVAYIRWQNANGSFDCRLLMSKARVAPLKTVTIPRLELNAAVLAVRLSRCIIREFRESFDGVYFWTDSVIVLRYINNTTSRFTTFVANRIQEILENSSVYQWRHVSSKDNPADQTSRGQKYCHSSWTVWVSGPAFLNRSSEEWGPRVEYGPGIEGLEIKKTDVSVYTNITTHEPLDRLISHYSSWTRLIKAAAWFARYKIYKRIMNGNVDCIRVGPLSVDELTKAEEDLIRYVQSTVFPREFKALCAQPGEVRLDQGHTSSLRRLNPLCERGLLCVGGRVQIVGMNVSSNPIILPKGHHLTLIIMGHYHHKEGHAGVSHILATIRERFWILHGGAAIKRVLSKCLICRRQNAMPTNQIMSTLPRYRIEAGWLPFQYVGLDYFGPLLVTRGRAMEKRYGCLFTCLQCRAIHLEMAQSMTTDSFILALMRFINKRGVPLEVHSDNGANFVGANRELREWLYGLNQPRIGERMAQDRIVWKFNPPAASHRGGAWERLIRSVRRILSTEAGKRTLNEETLLTFFSHAERIVNDRPITTVREGAGEPTPLRPSDLIQPKSKGIVAANLPLSQLSQRRWRVVNDMVAVFWKRWKSEYLSTLQVRQKWILQRRNLKENDIVILETESTPRTYWPLGLIAQVYPDTDGNVRTVDVKIGGGIVRKDIRKVYLLEGDN